MNLPSSIQLHNLVETAPHLGTGPEAWLRIPDNLRRCLNEKARQRAFHTSGCELRFRLCSPTFRIRIRTCDIGATQFGGGLAQVLFGDFSHSYFPVGEDPVDIEITGPDLNVLESSARNPLFHPRLVRLLLPTHAAICELALDGDFAPPEAGDIPSRRVLHYGSSITQGAGSLTSRGTWAAQCALHLRADLINLGFGGGCHCEPEMTDYLCARDDFDLAVIETGINMAGLDQTLAHERVEHLIRSFTKAHPDTPVFFLGVFPCAEDLRTGYTGAMQGFRDLVQRVVREIDSPRVHYLPGNLAMDPDTGLTTDLVHPSPAGMIQIGRWVSDRILERLA
ncbi:MAG: GDSL-type esterase/lipase family protein [Kiritimatiellae bacterium]|jgi:hypothetical protein|nr:GDSL-type esterase/lipase family protein [Kiritimatiellia bacterium]